MRMRKKTCYAIIEIDVKIDTMWIERGQWCMIVRKMMMYDESFKWVNIILWLYPWQNTTSSNETSYLCNRVLLTKFVTFDTFQLETSGVQPGATPSFLSKRDSMFVISSTHQSVTFLKIVIEEYTLVGQYYKV